MNRRTRNKSISPSLNTTEAFEDRNITSTVCRSAPNGLNNLNTEIDKCTSSVELNRNNNIVTDVFKLQKDIEHLRATTGDALMMGDSIFGKAGVGEITEQVKSRNHELKNKKEELKKNIDKKEAIIERSNRDFSDVKDTLPEKMPNSVLNFVEDYTLVFLIISYLFMIITVIYLYTLNSQMKIIGLLQSIIGSVFLSCFLFVMLYYFS
jgi:hypothetical protein